MTHTLIRTAAGVGAVVAVAVAGGLDAAMATADTGDHRAPVSQSRDGAHSRRDGVHHHGDRRRAREVIWREGWRDGFAGAGRLEDRESTIDPVARVTNLSVARPEAASPPAIIPETRDRAADVTVTVSGSSRRNDAVPMTRPTSPRVTFGDGRSPGVTSGRAEDLGGLVGVTPPTIAVVPVAPAPPMPVSPPTPPVAPPTVLERQHSAWSPSTPVTALWGRVEPGWPAGVIFGIAGLLLAPVGGIWLGRRHARAARVASELVSH